jgi:hypothetical protein
VHYGCFGLSPKSSFKTSKIALRREARLSSFDAVDLRESVRLERDWDAPDNTSDSGMNARFIQFPSLFVPAEALCGLKSRVGHNKEHAHWVHNEDSLSIPHAYLHLTRLSFR